MAGSDIKKSLEWFLDKFENEDWVALSEVAVDLNDTEDVQSSIHKISKNQLSYINQLKSIYNNLDLKKDENRLSEGALGLEIDKVINYILAMREDFQAIEKELETEKEKLIKKNLFETKYNDIFSKLHQLKDVEEIANIFLNEMCNSLNLQLGTFLLHQKKEDEDILEVVATYGHKIEHKFVEIGDGVCGQCFKDKKATIIKDENLKIESSFGVFSPKFSGVYPILNDSHVYGVIEIGSIYELDEVSENISERSLKTMGEMLAKINRVNLTEGLLDEIESKSFKLSSQKQALDCSAIVVETNAEGKITYVNDKFIEISKFPREELLGQDHRIVNSGYHPKEFFKKIWNDIKDGKVWNGEIKNMAKDGSYYWVDTTIYPHKDRKGKIRKFIAIRYDITEKKSALEKLEKTTSDAKNLAQVKTDFLSSMSHEIRTPINGIVGMTHLLMDKFKGTEDFEKFKIIKNSADNLLALINDILDFSKLEAGKVDIISAPVNLVETLDNIKSLLTPMASEKGILLEFITLDNTEEWVETDALRLRQILINLIGNAIKFTDTGKVTVIFGTKEVRDTNLELTFEIKDTGIGISKEDQSKLFESFSQINSSSTRKQGGTGLGLAICKELVELLKGSIWVSSTPGVGSSFSFSIEVQKTKGEGTWKKENVFETLNPKMNETYPLKILIAEDNEINQIVTKGYLSKLGYDATIAFNGLEVIEKFKKDNFDLVLMDCHMPEMDGLEATKILRSNFNHIRPVVIALTSSVNVQACMQVGMDGYLTKPLNIKELELNIIRAYKLRGKLGLESNKTVEVDSLISKEKILDHFCGDKELLSTMILKFRQVAPILLKRIEQAIESKNPKELEIAAHTFKGMSSNFFCAKVTLDAKKIEELAKSSSFAKSSSIYINLKQNVDQLITELLAFDKETKDAA